MFPDLTEKDSLHTEVKMSVYKIAYPIIPNMGDLINKDMLEDIFSVTVEQAELKNCNMIAIGSGLDHIFKSADLKIRLKQKVISALNNNVHIWCSGFIRENLRGTSDLIYKNINVHALRGELTHRRMEKYTGKKYDVPLGDGGLLAQRWIGEYPAKKYAVGIIPHFKEQEHPTVKKLLSAYGDSTLIDLRDTPKDVVRKIGECELIISSSLHGLIVADSFHVPNLHITLNNKMFGDGYKYRDYYSAFGLDHTPFDCANGDIPALDLVKSSCKISAEAVEEKKEALINAFPKL